MPRYSKKKRKPKQKRLKTTHQHSRFFGALDGEQWRVFQRQAADRAASKDATAHRGAYEDLKHDKLPILHAVKSELDDPVGGGIVDAVHDVVGALWDHNPIRMAWNLAQNAVYPWTHDNTISDHTKLVASAIQESYKPENERADYMEYEGTKLTRDQDLSTDYIDVWHNPVDQHTLVSVRGTKKNANDIADDVKIFATGSSRNRIQRDLARAVEKYDPLGTVEVAGHSLGANLIASALSDPSLHDAVDRIDFFNPGSTPLTKSSVADFTQSDKAYFYENSADLVGLGQQLYSSPPEHAIIRKPLSMDPLKNHSIDQWASEEVDRGQL